MALFGEFDNKGNKDNPDDIAFWKEQANKDLLKQPMKNRFFKPDPDEKLYRDKISGYIIWEGLTRQEHGIPDWRVAKNRYADYERGGTLKECQQYLITKFPVTQPILILQERYIITEEDNQRIITAAQERDKDTGLTQEEIKKQYTGLDMLTIRTAAKKTNPEFHKEEMDFLIAVLSGLEGVIMPYL